MNDKLQNICSGMLCHVRVFVSVHAASCYAPITIAAQSHPGWTDYPICVDRIDLQDIFIHLTIYSVGMGTRRPGTRQDLGPGTSRGLAEESRDVPRLYSCGPGTSRDPK